MKTEHDVSSMYACNIGLLWIMICIPMDQNGGGGERGEEERA